ncbi:MAG TPA: SprT-like domain-containing protein [Trueperaceae bacterium]|nr:SprT-like domain-containing protein [Trueperaceae bacterium]
MTLGDARALAEALLARHGLGGWSFAFDRARRRLGSCHPTQRRITLSAPLTLLNGEDVVRDTILHEIAHALTPGDGHGAAWRTACRRVGAKPERCAGDGEVALPPAPYALVCDRCGARYGRYRRTRGRYACGRCRAAAGVEAPLRWARGDAVTRR